MRNVLLLVLSAVILSESNGVLASMKSSDNEDDNFEDWNAYPFADSYSDNLQVVQKRSNPDMRRSSLDKNFMRFGKRGFFPEEKCCKQRNMVGFSGNWPQAGDGIMVSKRGTDANFMRFGRGDKDNFMRFGKGDKDNFMRFGKGDRDNFMRFGRGDKDNFMRFGRGDKDNFMRFGRGDKDNFMRFGRGDKDNFMRFGRGQDNFMRFGKGDDNFMRFGRKQDNFMRFGKGGDSFMRFGRAQDNFMRFGKGGDGFMRFGRGDDNFMRFGRGQDNFMRFGRDDKENFIRFGKSYDAIHDTDPSKLEDNLFRTIKADNFIRFGKRKYDRVAKSDKTNFLRFGRDLSDSTEDQEKVDESEEASVADDSTKSSPATRRKRMAPDVSVTRQTRSAEIAEDVPLAEEKFKKSAEENLSKPNLLKFISLINANHPDEVSSWRDSKILRYRMSTPDDEKFKRKQSGFIRFG